jgi:hypothetical protein
MEKQIKEITYPSKVTNFSSDLLLCPQDGVFLSYLRGIQI